MLGQLEARVQVITTQVGHPAPGLPPRRGEGGPPLSASCQPYAASKDVLSAVIQLSSNGGTAHFVIDPSALPSGTGMSIFDAPGVGAPSGSSRTQGTGSPPPAGITGPLSFGLVYSSQQCTG